MTGNWALNLTENEKAAVAGGFFIKQYGDTTMSKIQITESLSSGDCFEHFAWRACKYGLRN
jgi:hypothetical protein